MACAEDAVGDDELASTSDAATMMTPVDEDDGNSDDDATSAPMTSSGEADATSDGGASTTAASESSDTADDDDGDPPPNQLPPAGAAALVPWLEAGSYLDWAAESGIHASAGPHGGDVRTYVNAALFDSLSANATSHPVDAAVVKELYDGNAVAGWAVMTKVAPGEGGDTWYWYELVGSSTYADGIGEDLCSGCHQDGVDQVLTPFPLQ
jgi:hypothetical protein